MLSKQYGRVSELWVMLGFFVAFILMVLVFGCVPVQKQDGMAPERDHYTLTVKNESGYDLRLFAVYKNFTYPDGSVKPHPLRGGLFEDGAEFVTSGWDFRTGSTIYMLIDTMANPFSAENMWKGEKHVRIVLVLKFKTRDIVLVVKEISEAFSVIELNGVERVFHDGSLKSTSVRDMI